jgi:hypothetical protein
MHAIHTHVPGWVTAAMAASLLLILAILAAPKVGELGSSSSAPSAAPSVAAPAAAPGRERPVWLQDPLSAMQQLSAWPERSSTP